MHTHVYSNYRNYPPWAILCHIQCTHNMSPEEEGEGDCRDEEEDYEYEQ